MNIVFGKKRLVDVAPRNTSVVKYPEQAVITVESNKGAKKSRRILINVKAAEYLNLVVGEVENIVFAPIDDTREILIANTATIVGDTDEMVSYATSKNNVTFSDTNEKAKGITSSHMCKEIFKFLGEDADLGVDLEFQLSRFDSDSVEAYSLVKMSQPEVVAEDNNGNALSAQDIDDSVKNEVARAEEANPIETIEEDLVFDDEAPEDLEVDFDEVEESDAIVSNTPMFQRREEFVAE